MTTVFKALIAGCATLTITGTACAESHVVSYSPTAPAAQTYAQLESTAERVCRISLSEADDIAMKMQIERKCRADFLDIAVATTELGALIAYHQYRTGQARTGRWILR